MQIKEIHSIRIRSEKHLVNENEMLHHLIIKATLSNELTYLFLFEKDEEEKVVCLFHFEGFFDIKDTTQKSYQKEINRHNLSNSEIKEIEEILLSHPKVRMKALFLEGTFLSKRRFSRLLDLGFSIDQIFSR